jgi:hypothetical protein
VWVSDSLACPQAVPTLLRPAAGNGAGGGGDGKGQNLSLPDGEGWVGAAGWEEDLLLRNLLRPNEAGASGRAYEGLRAAIRCDVALGVQQVRARWKARGAMRRSRIAQLGLQKSYFTRSADLPPFWWGFQPYSQKWGGGDRRVKETLEFVRLRTALFEKKLAYQVRLPGRPMCTGGPTMPEPRALWQLNNATLRLEELLLECVGEYEKTRRRAVGRSAFLRSDCHSHSEALCDSLAWARFALRLEEDWARTMSVRHVDPRRQPERFREISDVATALLSRQAAPGLAQPKVRNVVEFVAVAGHGKRRPGGLGVGATGSNVTTPLCDDLLSVTGMLWKAGTRMDRRLRKAHPEVAFGDMGAPGGDYLALTTRAVVDDDGGRVEAPRGETLLSSDVVRWLLAGDDRWTGQRAVMPVNNRVYYCLEERARLGQQVGAWVCRIS